jgi:hypothetical protein
MKAHTTRMPIVTRHHPPRCPSLAVSCILILAVLSAAGAWAQSAPAGFKSRTSLWVGAGYTNMHASFPFASGQRMSGYGVLVDYHWLPLLDVEAEGLWLSHGGFEGTTESSYLAGPKHRFRSFHHIQPYGKFLVGNGRIHFPFAIGDGSYFALVPGGGATYSISKSWAVRGDYEMQYWLNSPGFANQPKHSFTPNGFQAGIVYRLHAF